MCLSVRLIGLGLLLSGLPLSASAQHDPAWREPVSQWMTHADSRADTALVLLTARRRQATRVLFGTWAGWTLSSIWLPIEPTIEIGRSAQQPTPLLTVAPVSTVMMIGWVVGYARYSRKRLFRHLTGERPLSARRVARALRWYARHPQASPQPRATRLGPGQ